MKSQIRFSNRNSRQFFLIVGAFCAYGLLIGSLIVLSASNPLARGETTFDIATIDFPASNAEPAAKAVAPRTAALPIQELQRKARDLPVEIFPDLN
ncbi:hypothetical protein [Afipia birgiae]|jgi:hypothetical protein|uniref:hypothetical protein n=1 Tax=Afipia birgiae TaxID=151414 RepID=UPI000302AD5C|nr:hypothetical protein [Afipia birgiae]MBX9820345.1 hypothetical protein [Afipia birgiae]